MSRPKKYILNSDFATLKNDSDTTTITVNVPATSLPPGIQTYTSTASIGLSGSPIEYDINYSLNSKRWVTTRFEFVENEGSAIEYQGTVFVYKSGESIVTVKVVVFNGSASSITKIARTVTVRARTFLSPFN